MPEHVWGNERTCKESGHSLHHIGPRDRRQIVGPASRRLTILPDRFCLSYRNRLKDSVFFHTSTCSSVSSDIIALLCCPLVCELRRGRPVLSALVPKQRLQVLLGRRRPGPFFSLWSLGKWSGGKQALLRALDFWKWMTFLFVYLNAWENGRQLFLRDWRLSIYRTPFNLGNWENVHITGEAAQSCFCSIIKTYLDFALWDASLYFLLPAPVWFSVHLISPASTN